MFVKVAGAYCTVAEADVSRMKRHHWAKRAAFAAERAAEEATDNICHCVPML